MRDRDFYAQDPNRVDRDDDDRWNEDDQRARRDERNLGQRYPEQQRSSSSPYGSGSRSDDRGGYGGEGYRGGRYGGSGPRNYGREQTEWSPARGGEPSRAAYPSSFGGNYRGGSGYRGESRPYTTGFYGGARETRGSERNYGIGYGGYGDENDRGGREESGLLERAGEWLQRKLGKAPKGYKRSDERIREDVCDVFMRRYEVDASDVDVSVVEGEVTLAGTVPERHMKRLLEDLAEDVLGVNDVHNHVKVSRQGASSTTASPSTTEAPKTFGDKPLAGRTTSAGASASTSSRPSS